MKRADQVLVDFQLARSRTHAVELIKNGYVDFLSHGDWQPVKKPSQLLEIANADELRVDAGLLNRFVSRGGVKLQGALEKVGLDVRGLRALDIGQSTGGFTDCLIQAGAAHVYGIDVGRDQIAPNLKSHPKVTAIEGAHVQDLDFENVINHLGRAPDLVVADVSFISMTKVLPQVVAKVGTGPQFLLLIKPQFEVGSSGLGKGGRVKDPALYESVRQKIIHMAEELGLECRDYFPSSIDGGDGNKEFFLYAVQRA